LLKKLNINFDIGIGMQKSTEGAVVNVLLWLIKCSMHVGNIHIDSTHKSSIILIMLRIADD